jgi:O-antigen/teichoic acid export membrane protein
MSGPVTAEPITAPAATPSAGARPGLLRTITHGGDVALAAARISAIVLTAASSAVVARTLGPQSYGVFAAGTAVATLMVLGKAFGADALYLRGSIDGRTLQRRAVGAGLVNLAVVAIAAVAWPGLSWAARGCELLMGAAWAVAFARIPWQVVPARQLEFAGRARRELLGSVLSLGGVMIFAAVWHRPLLASAGLLAGTLVTTAISWPAIRRERLAPASADGAPVQGDASVQAGLRFTAIEGLFVSYFALGGALVAAMRPAVDAGTYRVAFSFVVAAAVVPVALNADVLRVRLWRLTGAERTQALRRAVLLTAAAAVVVTVGFEALGGVAERLFFGTKFTAAIAIIRILGVAMPFHYANSLLSNMLVGAGRTSAVIRVQVAMLVTNLTVNLILIPDHGPKGAAVATVMTEVVGLVLFACVARLRGRYSDNSV